MQPIKIKYKKVQPVQSRICQRNTYKRLLLAIFWRWAKGSRETASVVPTVLHSCFCSLSNIQVAATISIPDMTTVFHVRLYGWFIAISSNVRKKKHHRKNQGSNFLVGSFSNGENKRIPIQFRREKNNGRILKGDFLPRLDPSIFTSIAPQLFNESNETRWVFLALKSINDFLF